MTSLRTKSLNPSAATRPGGYVVVAGGTFLTARQQAAVIIVVALTAFSPRVFGAPFVNLDFEQATVVPTFPPYYIDAAAAFPGWTMAIGGVTFGSVTYNDNGIGEGQVALWDRPDPSDVGQLLQGRYMAALTTDNAHGDLASLTQTGDIPPDARSIRLLGDGGRGPAAVSINGIDVPMVRLSGVAGYNFVNLFGGDVSAFAGHAATLTVSSRFGDFDFTLPVDDVRFSAVPIPEPRSLAAALLGCLTICTTSRRWQGTARLTANTRKEQPGTVTVLTS